MLRDGDTLQTLVRAEAPLCSRERVIRGCVTRGGGFERSRTQPTPRRQTVGKGHGARGRTDRVYPLL